MIKVRYNLITRQLSGWGAETEELVVRDGEAVEVLAMDKPDVGDYEYFAYIGGGLEPSGKQLPKPVRDLAAEIDELKARIDNLKVGVGTFKE